MLSANRKDERRDEERLNDGYLKVVGKLPLFIQKTVQDNDYIVHEYSS